MTTMTVTGSRHSLGVDTELDVHQVQLNSLRYAVKTENKNTRKGECE
jgi:hypothetical protein